MSRNKRICLVSTSVLTISNSFLTYFRHFLNRQVGSRNIRQKKKESESEDENTDDDEPIVDRIERDHPEAKEDVVKEETVKVLVESNYKKTSFIDHIRFLQ